MQMKTTHQMCQVLFFVFLMWSGMMGGEKTGSLSLTIKYAIIKNAVLHETVALERVRSQ